MWSQTVKYVADGLVYSKNSCIVSSKMNPQSQNKLIAKEWLLCHHKY